MPTPLTEIRNIGPALAGALMRTGIDSAEALRDLGADTAYARLLQSGTRPHFIGYYVMHMALQGRPWNDCRGDEKRALRVRFDALKARCFDQGRSEFVRCLDEIGVIAWR